MNHSFDEKSSQILEKHGLRKTDTRLSVLHVFFRYNHAIAHSTLEKELGNHFDRVTLYRTLHTFQDSGIIHSVPTAAGENRFALCKDSCDTHSHQDHHLHFYCSQCEQTYCLEEATLPSFHYPTGYKVDSLHVLASGICKNCVK